MRHSSYLQEIFKPQEIVDSFVRLVPKDVARMPNVVYVGTGLSGTAALFILKQAGYIDHVGIVRKEGEKSHATFSVEMSCDIPIGQCRWVFIDDMIDSGSTFKKVKGHFTQSNLLGAFLYHDPRWRTAGRLIARYDPEDNIPL